MRKLHLCSWAFPTEMRSATYDAHPAPGPVATTTLDFDILCAVCDGSRGPQGLLTNSDLVHCALVSRTFSEAALRALWRNLPTLLPFWHVLAPLGLGYPEKHRATAEYFDEVRIVFQN